MIIVACIEVANGNQTALGDRRNLYSRSDEPYSGHDGARPYIEISAFGNRRSLDAERNTKNGENKEAIQGWHDGRAPAGDLVQRGGRGVLTV